MTDYELWELDLRSRMMADQAFPAEMLPCIERFFREVDPTLPPGQDLYPEVFETDLFFPLQRQAELRRMIQIVRRVGQMDCAKCDGGKVLSLMPCEDCGGCGKTGGPKTVMEIGADKGAGVYHWVKCLPSVEQVIACEIRGTPYKRCFEAAFCPAKNFLWVDGPSLGTYPWGQTVPGFIDEWLLQSKWRRIDVLFIDGDKSAFLQDFDAYLPLMNPEGIVFMHDINEPGSPMRRAFEAVKARGYRTEEVIDKSDWELSAIREAHGIPPANPHEAWLRHWRGRSCGVGVIHLNKE